jgi:hypothetical protein
MAHRVGIDLSDVLAAIGVVEASLPAESSPNGVSAFPGAEAPVSVIVLHGSLSPSALCGSPSSVLHNNLPSQDPVFSYWTGPQANRCGLATPNTFCTGGSMNKGSMTNVTQKVRNDMQRQSCSHDL